MTFVLNALLLRFLTKELLGIVNVRLVLLYSTILFLSREAFRRACLSTQNNAEEKHHKGKVAWLQTINLLWCMIPVGIVCTCVCIYSWLYFFENPDPMSIPHYNTAVVVFGGCALVELIVEPLWIVGQVFLFVKLKVVSESLAMLVKCVVTVVLVVFFPRLGLLAFCISSISFSVTYILIYYGYFIWFIRSDQGKKLSNFPFSTPRDLFPNFQVHNFIDFEAARLTFSFLKQSILKQFLTEGERYVMTFLNVLSFADQGIYDVINNLGSLAARFLFLPIEESFYPFFAKIIKRGEIAKQQPHEEMKAVSKVLFCLLRLVVVIALIILSFGIPYSKLLLDLYGGNLLSTGVGPTLLKFYCLYVLCIAINGTTEGFVFAVMNQLDVDRYNKKMFLFSILFLTSSYFLTNQIGSLGFILANCLNMTARIVHSIYYINKFYSGSNLVSPLHGLIPSKYLLSSLIISSIVCSFTEASWCCDLGWSYKLLHIFVGAVCLCFTFVVIYFQEKELLNFLEKNLVTKYKQKSS